nr:MULTISPECIES: glycosyltransferase [unclassified Cobetia]
MSLVTNKKVISFNNTEVSKKEFRAGVYSDSKKLKLLFVGRNQERKRLDRLIELAKRLSYIELKLVGPGMDKLIGSDDLPDNIQTYGHTTGVKLNSFFDWCDVVVNPGHVGLLVMNAARHGKSIIIDSSSNHAPEYILAEESDQSFIDFSNINKVIEHMNKIYENQEMLKTKAQKLQERAFQEYNIEQMAKIHYEFFCSISNGNVV